MAALEYPRIISSIADFEGFDEFGSVAAMNNNPGNIIYGNFARNHGAIGSDVRGFAIFPNTDSGFTAADRLVDVYADQGYTVEGLINRWAPPNAPGNTPQSTQNYINFLSRNLGVPSNTLLTDAERGTGPTTDGAEQRSIWDRLGSIIDIGGAIATGEFDLPVRSAVGNAVWDALGIGRLGAFLLGLVLVAGAIYLIKPSFFNGIARSAATGGIA